MNSIYFGVVNLMVLGVIFWSWWAERTPDAAFKSWFGVKRHSESAWSEE